MYDVIIIGGGPAGLSAALVLGRCRRKVLVFDRGNPRNSHSHGLHGFITRDGILPLDLLKLAREEMRSYPVELINKEVVSACKNGSNFEISTNDGQTMLSRKLLIATGVVDCLPPIENIEAFYGSSVFHCPYCDGWEVRDLPIAVYGSGKQGFGLSLLLLNWSSDVVLCSDGPGRLTETQQNKLVERKVEIISERIARLNGTDGSLQQIIFSTGRVIERKALFFSTGQVQRSDLPAQLQCRFTSKGAVRKDKLEKTNVPGLYVAGDASEDVQFAVVAAAEGAKAAYAINTELVQEDFY